MSTKTVRTNEVIFLQDNCQSVSNHCSSQLIELTNTVLVTIESTSDLIAIQLN